MSQPPTRPEQEPAALPATAKPIQFTLRTAMLLVLFLCAVLGAWRLWGLGGGYLAVSASVVLLIRVYTRSWLRAVAGGFGLMLLGGLGTAMLYSGIRSGPASPKSQCGNNMRQIFIALQLYEVIHGTFPPAYTVDAQGNRLHSWRTLILPFLELGNLQNAMDLNQPWDAPVNRQAADFETYIYQCPSNLQSRRDPSFTSYVAVVGPNTMWPGERGRHTEEVKDGLSRTILLVEYAGSDIAWAEPRDLTLEEVIEAFNAGEITGIGSYHEGGAHAAYADGHVEFLDPSTLTEAKLRAMFNVNDNALPQGP